MQFRSTNSALLATEKSYAPSLLGYGMQLVLSSAYTSSIHPRLSIAVLMASRLLDSTDVSCNVLFASHACRYEHLLEEKKTTNSPKAHDVRL